MTPKELDAIRAREQAASEGPVICPLCGEKGTHDTPHCNTPNCKFLWSTIPTIENFHNIRQSSSAWEDAIPILGKDAERMMLELVHARKDVPDLLEHIEEMQKRITYLERECETLESNIQFETRRDRP